MASRRTTAAPNLIWAPVLLIVAASSPAWADILLPDEQACLQKKVGDPCAVDAAPAPACDPTKCQCENSTCPRTRYVCTGVDAGPDGPTGDGAIGATDAGPDCSVQTVVESCVRCGLAMTDATTDAPLDAPSEAQVDASEEAPALGTGGDSAAEAGPGPGSSGGGWSCWTAPGPTWQTVAPWLLASLVPLALRRRRPRG